ncbi:MAG: hypothetical protein J6D29_00670 [Solobacterium sp.]|nr:hypothetical protein [Solobacterium sp.]
MKNNSRLKDVLFTLAFPIGTWLIMEILCLTLKDVHAIKSMLDIKTIIRNTGIAAVTAYALSFNLHEGRFDLSLGAQRLAGTILGGLLAIKLGLTGFAFLLFAIIFGFIFGLLTGLAFIGFRVPPMVLGVGMALIWEVIPYVVSGGKGLNLFGAQGMGVLTESWFQILVVILMAIFVMILMNYTRLGYETKAVQGSQLIAQNSGINIFRHAVECYALAGALVCIAGVLDVSFTTQMSASLGNTSNGVVSANMFAMILGGYIGERSDQSIGIIVAALTLSIFKYALSMMQLSEANNSVVNMVIFIAFLVFQANRHVRKLHKEQRARVALAQEKKANRTEAVA